MVRSDRTASTGIAMALNASTEELLDRANVALMKAKDAGPGHHEFSA